jgi:hypothetical protein
MVISLSQKITYQFGICLLFICDNRLTPSNVDLVIYFINP